MYALYSKNKPHSDALMSSYGNTFFKVEGEAENGLRGESQEVPRGFFGPLTGQAASSGGPLGFGLLPAEAHSAHEQVCTAATRAGEGLWGRWTGDECPEGCPEPGALPAAPRQ